METTHLLRLNYCGCSESIKVVVKICSQIHIFCAFLGARPPTRRKKTAPEIHVTRAVVSGFVA